MDFQPTIPLLLDIEHHLQQNNIIVGHEEAPNARNPEGAPANHPTHQQRQDTTTSSYRRQDLVELEANVSAQLLYQNEVIDKFLKEDEEIEKIKEQPKELVIRKCQGLHISLLTQNEMVVEHVELDRLVEHCDTFLTLVRSDCWASFLSFKSTTIANNSSSNSNSSSSNSSEREYIFSLQQFSMNAVKVFLKLVRERSKPLCDAQLSVEDILSGTDVVIECCHLAHFLQAREILEDIVAVIQSSIDSENCASICMLADELQIPSLLQTSMRYVMERLDNIQENKELWEDIPLTLRNQISTLKHAAESSIIGRGQTKEVIFSSGNEFLAIFHDTLTAMKERLKDAQQRQREIIQERLRIGAVVVGGDENDNGDSDRDRNFMPGRFSKRFVQDRNVYGGSVEDAAIKIQKQEERIRTLQAFYDEQKAIFRRDLEGDGYYQKTFKLSI